MQLPQFQPPPTMVTMIGPQFPLGQPVAVTVYLDQPATEPVLVMPECSEPEDVISLPDPNP